ncbi:MAG TPA: pilin [Patescibacteria group bacterium]|nr:pilin [Patescibacteria group bacterium]
MALINKRNKIHLGFLVCLVSALAFMAIPHSASAVAARCFDAMAGVAYTCPASAGGIKVDGKTDGKFLADTCYVYADATKGWEVEALADCKKDGRFDNLSTTSQPVPTVKDTGECPSYLQNQAGSCDIIGRYLNPAINALSAVVGLVVVISLVIGAIQYSSSRDNPQAVGAAKKRITNAILALVSFFLLWAFLQWIVPGGFLNG